MDEAMIAALVSASGTIIALVEKYGPEAWTTIKNAVENTTSSTGPTDADIAAIYAKCQADNDAIQAS
ncbi:hypothetical protein Gdia_2438 [Gluconacetobacter diazotrophicus PA1 5]|uniref:hypothetical protein n=1 Tax=Gluconacetobacter diazotrophicus TaxID=33996 RepID=UPI000173D9ED|nr:hypothetical protein [Gluconacetobacter diazotrophicus]ACI52183.1 hypothetical protein Gdia_2438 [Gluconacetobacter diazotrophicus PA1 5]TWA98221.1 hypothetical protein FBZ86_14912 [Gluconacetobacter diazotrophicus]